MPKIPFDKLSGPILKSIKSHADSRGSFTKVYDSETSEITSDLPLSFSVSRNELAGTLRGLHFQITPHAEIKVISCLAGKIFDVVVDIRPTSPNFGNWACVELSSEDPRQLYIPHGFAHGFQTLVEESFVSYMIWGRFVPQASRRINYNDRRLGILWPLPISKISDDDAHASEFEIIAQEL